MEHRQIQYFLAVARTGSFSRAAEELHVATSSVSRQIKRLEDDLGAALFDRTDGSVRLTDAGHVLMPEAINLTEGIENARAAVQELTGPVEGRVAIITGEGWEVWPFWPEMVRQFRERHPGISTTIHQAPSTEAMLKAVASGEADIAIIAVNTIPFARDMRIDAVYEEPVWVTLPPDHRLAQTSPIPLEELRDETWVLAGIARPIVEHALGTIGAQPRYHDVGEANTAYVRDEVISGRGLSICGVSEVEWWEPAAAAPTSPPTHFTLALAYRNAYRKATTRVVRDFLTDQLGEIAKLVNAVPDPLRGI